MTSIASTQKRLTGIDIGRFIAMIGVVLIHTASAHHFQNDLDNASFGIDAGGVIDQLSRFAVPFFFIVSGYFIQRQMDKPLAQICLHIARRLIPIYAFWSTLYVLASPERLIWLTQPSYILRWLVNGGIGYHLWFLPSLGFSLCFAVVLKKYFFEKQIIIFSLALFMVGLAFGSYLPLIIHNAPVYMKLISRNSPCFGLIFVISGMYLYHNPIINLKLKTSFAICVFGAIIQIFEAFLLDNAKITPFSGNNYLFGTLPFAFGAFMIALHINTKNKVNIAIGTIGQYSLGIYAIHLGIMWELTRLIHPVALTTRLLIAFITLLSSIFVVMIAKQIKQTQFLFR